MDKKLFKDCLIIIVYTVALVVCLVKIDSIFGFIGSLLALLSSMFLGILMALLLNAPYRYFRQLFLRRKSDTSSGKPLFRGSGKGKKIKGGKKGDGLASGLALTVTYLLFAAALVLIIWFVVPQIALSIGDIKDNAEAYSQNLIAYLSDINDRYLSGMIDFGKLTASFNELLSNALKAAGDITGQVISFTTGVVSGVTNFALGVIFSIYFLLDKDRLRQRAGELAKAYIPDRIRMLISDAARLSGDVLSSYLVGRVSGALITGLLCFTGLSVTGFGYPVFIAVVIAVFCLLPVFGQVIGCIISILLILLIEPASAVWYLLFFIAVFILTDRFILPHIRHEKYLLPPLLVLLAAVAGGYTFGFWGIFLSVPAATVLYALIPGYIRRRSRSGEKADSVKADIPDSNTDNR